MTPFDEKMEALRARFRDRAQDDRARLSSAFGVEDRAEVLRIAHGLSGTAGTFGYADVSEAAHALEMLIDDHAGADELRRAMKRLDLLLAGLDQPR